MSCGETFGSGGGGGFAFGGPGAAAAFAAADLFHPGFMPGMPGYGAGSSGSNGGSSGGSSGSNGGRSVPVSGGTSSGGRSVPVFPTGGSSSGSSGGGWFGLRQRFLQLFGRAGGGKSESRDELSSALMDLSEDLMAQVSERVRKSQREEE
jgi:hypothetical protein